MGRPKSNNPKNKHIGIVTTADKYRRFKELNLVGDRAIDVLLYYLENDNKRLQMSKIEIVNRIKDIDNKIKDLEYERLQLETELEEVNKKIGLTEAGFSVDVEKAVNVILQRYDMQKDVYNIMEFLDNNETLLENQAYLCGISSDKLWELVFNKFEVKV